MESNGLTIWRGYLPLLTVLFVIHDISTLVPRASHLTAREVYWNSFINKKELPLPDKKLGEASNLDNLLTLRNVCIFLLAKFAGFLRIEEVLHIKYGDITFHDTYVAIKVDRGKIDQLRKGNGVVLSRSSSQDTCPVSIFKRYVSELERFPVEPSHYVFKQIGRASCRERV